MIKVWLNPQPLIPQPLYPQPLDPQPQPLNPHPAAIRLEAKDRSTRVPRAKIGIWFEPAGTTISTGSQEATMTITKAG
jgi:hypothetical protein